MQAARIYPPLALVGLLGVASCLPSAGEWRVAVEDAETSVESLLIGLDPADHLVVWTGGTGGTFGRSLDGGRTWRFGVVPGADSLQFRDVHAVDSSTAYLLSIGPGDQSRIYRTDTGGLRWDLQWVNAEPRGFFDCLDFWTPSDGIAMGDAVDGRIMVVKTENGRDWELIDPGRLPAGSDGEGGFAASGTCLVARGDSAVWIGTGAPDAARVYRSLDRGASWDVVSTPIVSGMEASGIMTLAFVDEEEGYAAGGVLSRPDDTFPNLAASVDGGRSWELRGSPQLPNIYGLAATRIDGHALLLAVGPKGLDVSFDSGNTWTSIDKRSYWSVRFTGDLEAIAVGPAGRISRISIDRSTDG